MTAIIADSPFRVAGDRRRLVEASAVVARGPHAAWAQGQAVPRPSPKLGAYGPALAERFHLAAAPTLVSTMLKTGQLAVTRLQSRDGIGRTLPIPAEKAWLVSVALEPVEQAALWRAGEPDYRGDLGQGALAAVQLEEAPAFALGGGFDLLSVYIPAVAFEELADDFGVDRINALAIATGTVDPVVRQLGLALLPARSRVSSAGRLFFDHIALAICAHLATRYGALAPRTDGAGPPLSPWQERLAKELLAADLTDEPSIPEIARACHLTPRRFLRAFRETTGMPPYRWLRGHRIDRAKELLLQSTLSLAQIAYDCGFADQSHFTRAFAGAVGVTPGAWRRARRG